MSAIAVALLILLVLVLAAVSANVAVHWPRARSTQSGPRTVAPRLSPRALFDEGIATVLALLGPLALLLPAPRSVPTRDDASLVVLRDPRLPPNAHWLLLRRLRRGGWRVVTGLPSGFPLDGAAVDRLAGVIAARVGGGAPITLIGIGSSGLLARQLAARNATFARIVTVATPHQGSFSTLLPVSCRPQSAYLQAVARMDERPRKFDAIAVYSDGDGWLEPSEAAYLPGAFNLEVHGIGHLAMLFSWRVFGYLEENIAAPLPVDVQR